MNKSILLITLLTINPAIAQTLRDSTQVDAQRIENSAQRIITNSQGKKVIIGGYGEVTYNQEEGDNGELDVQRLVLLFGYNFNDVVQFVTEIELEHVQEIFVEQAFINYSVGANVSLRGGLMLVPMGLINEYHEPTTFNGTERPMIDNVIVPTTWREIGVGVNGRFPEASLGYQVYIFNGFKSTTSDGDNGLTGLLKGKDGLRGGRQKGIQSTVDTPTLSAKIDYYAIPGLRLGASGYFGKTQADDDVEDLSGANIGITMIGLDARYTFGRFTARGQLIYTALSDTEAYNAATGKDLGSELYGYYVEGAFNLLSLSKKQRLFAFGRFERYDTHASTTGSLQQNEAYQRQDITTGLSYHITPGVVVKGDYQFRNNALDGDTVDDRLNFGIGVWF